MHRSGGLAAIGDTPVVAATRLVDSGCAEVWVKLESANPTMHFQRSRSTLVLGSIGFVD